MTLPEPPSISHRSAARPFAGGFRRLRLSAFTLMELLCVITIIAILASMLMPAVGSMQQRANSIQCTSNLRTIGVAEQAYLQDHGFIFPCIEMTPEGTGSSVYPANFQPTPYISMVAAFGSYGVSQQTTECPSDMKSPNPPGCSFTLYGSSYDWRPTLDDETVNQPLIYTRRFFATSGSSGALIAKLSKVRQVYDDNSGSSGTGIHFGHRNALYADGHVIFYSGAAATSSSH
jgi:prepilin-type N-terminal cleavage/methylation domain-containing protein/prepilin-type processing-associated H-X9-DG protein